MSKQVHVVTDLPAPKNILSRIPVKKTLAATLVAAGVVATVFALKDQIDVEVETTDTPDA